MAVVTSMYCTVRSKVCLHESNKKDSSNRSRGGDESKTQSEIVSGAEKSFRRSDVDTLK